MGVRSDFKGPGHLGFLFLLAFLLFIGPLAAYAGAELPSQQSKKIESFLSAVMQAKTINDVGNAFKAANFTQAELSQLDKRLKQQPYAGKLSSLAKIAGDGVAVTGKGKLSKAVQSYKNTLDNKRRQELNSRNQKAQAQLQVALQTKKIVTTAQQGVKKSEPLSDAAERQMRAHAGTGGTGASLNGIRIVPVFVRQQLTITGSGLGSSGGHVVIVVGDVMVYNPIISWRDNQIIITVSPDIGPLLGSAQRTGRLWVKLRGQEIGPYTSITLKNRNPQITSTSTPDVMPGQNLVIRGSYFGSAPGSVRFVVGARGFSGAISSWSDGYIGILVDDSVGGLMPQDCIVRVTNQHGLTGTRTIRFTPAMETRLLRNTHEVRRYTNVFGHKQTYTDFNYPLLNGWTVANSLLEHEGHGPGHGAHWVLRPTVGSTTPKSRVEVWVDAFSASRATVTVAITGPRGLPHKR